jgi:hypothetical protein
MQASREIGSCVTQRSDEDSKESKVHTSRIIFF